MNLNLIDYSSTFPEHVVKSDETEIPLDSKVREIRKKFGPNSERIILQGPRGSGKTVHLAQFVKFLPHRSFSYFMTDNMWTCRQSGFLFSLCKQMSALLGAQFPENDLGRIDLERLKIMFENLIDKVIEVAKKQKESFYFVVDGLECAYKGAVGERIIDIMPRTNSKGLYLLGSVCSTISEPLPFSFLPEGPHLFSELETKNFLEGLKLESAQLLEVRDAFGGMPGYLSVMRELLKKGLQLTKILETPSEMEALLEIQWKTSNVQSSGISKSVHALLAYSLAPLPPSTVAKIIGTEEDVVKSCLREAGLVIGIDSDNIQFCPELLKNIVQNRLGMRDETLAALVKYYEENSQEKGTNLLLSEYYRKLGNFTSLVQLLAPERLVSVIQENNDLNAARRSLNQACEMAKGTGDLSEILRFGLACSQMRSISNELIGESEVQALVAMKQFDEALELAYSAKLTRTRIRLLSHIYLAIEQEGNTVPRRAIAELEQMIKMVGQDTEPDELLLLATDVFPLLPDAATRLIDEVKGQENTRNAIDLVAMLASVRSQAATGEHLFEKIQDIELREIALAHAPWLSKLSASALIRKASQTNQTKAKEYLFRQWCLQNKNSPEVHLVVDAALDAINADDEYRIPLRNLRQLSETLRYCDLGYRERLINRFDVPKFTSLYSPTEEWFRLELNLAEATLEISQIKAIERFNNAYNKLLQLPLDTDVACYCFARVLVTLSKLDPDNKQLTKIAARQKIEEEFVRLLYTSADQLRISLRTLRATCLVDPKLAFEFADMLNTVERREQGFQEVVAVYIRQDRLKIDKTFLKSILDKICDKRLREQTILRIITEAQSTGKFADPEIRDFLTEIAQTIEDPIVLCKSLARLIAVFNAVTDNDNRRDLFDKLIEAWERIDIIWQRVEAGFDLIMNVVIGDKSFASELYGKTKAIRDTSPLATQTIGVIFYGTLGIAARFTGGLDFSKPEAKEVWERLVGMVELVPSYLLRSMLFARMALTRLRQGDKNTFDSLVRDRVLPELRMAGPSEIRDKVTAIIVTAVFEYSPEEAQCLVKSLSYRLRNAAWLIASLHILRNTNIGDPVDDEPPNVAIDLQCANKILLLLGYIDHDQSVYLVVKALARAVANTSSQLNEGKRLDILARLESLLTPKLPDPKNIQHCGYKTLCQAEIEKAIKDSAKRSATEQARARRDKVAEVIQNAQALENIADRILVMTDVATLFRELRIEAASRLLDEALSLTSQIPNVRDRIGRLEIVATGHKKSGDMTKASEAVKLASQLASSLVGVDRDAILSSVIQMAHELDKKIAADLTEKIEDPIEQYSLDKHLKALELAKNPHKPPISCADSIADNEMMLEASSEMMKILVNGKGVSYSRSALAGWLSSIALLDFRAGLQVAEWGAELLVRQGSSQDVNTVSMVNSLLLNCELTYLVGGRVAFLTKMPETLRQGFHGLSTNKKLFKVGERDKAIAWVVNWLRDNARQHVNICDPYFDPDQLWILQAIPADLEVKIISTGQKLGISSPTDTGTHRPDRDKQKRDREKAMSLLHRGWDNLSGQTPPPTLMVIHGAVYDSEKSDEFHDRYITTIDAGLSLGTSLNGFGNKEFFITVLTPEDVRHVDETYIVPKLEIEKIFSKVIYFELE